MSTAENIAKQSKVTYQSYKKIKDYTDIGHFLDDYVISGGEVTKDPLRNDQINISEISAVISNDVMTRDGTSLTVSSVNTTYYVDFWEGDFTLDTVHPPSDYLPLAQVKTDSNGLISEVIDLRTNVGGLRVNGDVVTRNGTSLDGIVSSMNNLNSTLDNISTIKIASDIDSTEYKQGDRVDFEKLRTTQISKLALVMRKLRTGESIKIACKGDSLTYGSNNASGTREISSELTDTGRSHVSVRAEISYPEALEEYLNEVYGEGKVEVENLGYEGAWTEWHYIHYYKKRNNDLTLFMLGTNDSRGNGASWAGDIEMFVYWYEQLIIRELIWGKALVILTPPRTLITRDINIDTFSNALQYLGHKYCIPVVDGGLFVHNYNSDIFSDSTHFTEEGYRIIGSKVASLFIGEGLMNYVEVKSGTTLLTREPIDGIKHISGCLFTATSSGYTPRESTQNRIYLKITDGKAIYSFYNTEDNLVVLPTVAYYPNSKLTMKLDFGLKQPETELVTAQWGATSDDGVRSSVYEHTAGSSNQVRYKYSYALFKDTPLIINGVGWHTLLIETIGEVNFFGLEFIGYDEWNKRVTEGEFSTQNRPTGITRGHMIFDSTLGKPVWWNGSDWVDSTGTIV